MVQVFSNTNAYAPMVITAVGVIKLLITAHTTPAKMKEHAIQKFMGILVNVK